MTRIGKTAAPHPRRDGSPVAVEDVFVSIDLDGEVAYVAYEDESTIRWEEIPRGDGELLVRMGARAHVHLRSAARIGITTGPAGVIGPSRAAGVEGDGSPVNAQRRSA